MLITPFVAFSVRNNVMQEKHLRLCDSLALKGLVECSEAARTGVHNYGRK